MRRCFTKKIKAEVGAITGGDSQAGYPKLCGTAQQTNDAAAEARFTQSVMRERSQKRF